MPISWTLIVLGTLLQGMQCNANDNTTTASKETPPLTTVNATTAYSTKSTIPLITLSSTKPIISSASLASTTLATTLTSLVSTKATTSASLTSTTLATTLTSSELTKSVALSATLASTTLATALTSSEPTEHPSSSPNSTKQAALMTIKGTSPEPTETSSTVAKKDLPSNTSSQNALVTTQITTIQPKTSNAGTTPTAFNNNPQNSTTNVITTNPITTKLNKPATSISTDSITQLLSTQTNPSDVTRHSTLPSTAAPDSKSTASQSLGTTKAQTTTASIIPGQRSDEDTSTSTHSYDLSSSTEENIVRQACKTLGQKMKGNCSVTVKIHDKRLIAEVIIDADQEIPPGNYQPTNLEPVSGVTNNDALQKDDGNKDTIPDTLIAILASCSALVLILCCFAAYCTYHRRSYRKNQQHLTEELQTVENGYHDNPTLEVMEVQPEMQEKKLKLNGEFNDSWIVPIDNLLKEDITDEEDTHL